MKQLLKDFKLNYKLLIAPLIFIAFAFTAKTYTKNSKENAVSYFKEVKRPGYETSPAYYVVSPSASKAWELAHQTTIGVVCELLAIICFWIAIAVVVMSCFDYTARYKPWQTTTLMMLFLVLWLSFKYGAHSEIVSNTTVTVSPDVYEHFKQRPGGLDELFDSKEKL